MHLQMKSTSIRFLATGASFASLAFSFRLGKSTVGAIVKETTQVLWDNMFTIHMPQPNEQCFQEIAEQYWMLWNFPNCIGAIDGKHIRIKCPGNTGSIYYNYKHFFSIVLQGIADANCKFIAVEVGGYGKQSDGGTFSA
uniref:Putative nuclease HARBI1 n=1 Tax=Bactrocera latifrons TaxID=174628 RepID=A0A0K8U346_BACLA